ncbi:MAG: Ig-like domain-containing protein [Pseudomonadales bacterium]|nr:Ig-like domain-containing protein [Pseudomonadales bacterium]
MPIKKFVISMTLSAGVITLSCHANTAETSAQLKIASNKSPRITTSSLPAAKEGTKYVYQLAAKDPEAQKLHFSLLNGPKALKVDKEGRISFTPAFDTAGEYSVVVTVSDGVFINQKTLALKVNNTNRAPVFKSRPKLHAAENFNYIYAITSHDEDSDDKLTLSLIDGPEGLILKNDQLQWLPGFKAKGSHGVKLKLTDQHSASASQNFSLKVNNTNQLPRWKTQQLTAAKEAQAYKKVLLAEDSDGQKVTYTLITGPEGLKLTSAGQLSFTPDYTQAGEHRVIARASDGISGTEIKFALLIENTNRPPVFNSKPLLDASENIAYHYELRLQDEDRDNVILKLTEAPAGMILEGRELHWLPDFEAMGQHKVIISANDNKDVTEQTFFIHVASTNRLPSFNAVAYEKTLLKENMPWSLKLETRDDDGHKVLLSLKTGIQGLTLSDNTLSWTPGYEQAGMYNVIVNANDGLENKTTLLNLQVANTNRAPVIHSLPLKKAVEGTEYRYIVDASDADKSILTLTLSTAPKGMVIINNNIVWNPNYQQSGKHNIELLVNDGDTHIKQQFEISVANTNRVPVFDSQPIIQTAENSDYQYNVSVFDPDGAAITLSLLDGPDGMELVKLKNADKQAAENIPRVQYALRYTPDFEAVNSYKVLLQAEDPESTAQQAFNLDVMNTNRLPVFHSTPGDTAHENITYHYKLSASDADNETLTFSIAQAPEGMQLNGKQLSWHPNYQHSGEHSVVILVSDGIDQVEQRFTVKVKETNREPFIAKVNSQQVIAKQKFKYTLVANDIDGSKLNFRLVHGPETMQVSRSGKLSWRTSIADIGSHTILVEASDGDLKFRRHFDLKVIKEQIKK